MKPGDFSPLCKRVAMEHWISPRVWVRRDPLSQDREQLLPRYHHSLHPWQGLGLLDSCTTTNPPDPLLLLHLKHRGFAEQRGFLYRIPEEDTQESCSSKRRRKHALDCIWAQITGEKKRKGQRVSTPDSPMRCQC